MNHNYIFELNCFLYSEKNSDCQRAEHYGIISPYNNQVQEIKKKLSSKRELRDIEVNTVDQYQGRDKDLIIMSFTNACVKAEESKVTISS